MAIAKPANRYIHPASVLYRGGKRCPALAACEHYAGSENLIRKALQLQRDMKGIFDVTADCEDGAPAGTEAAHAGMIADLILELGSKPESAVRAGKLGVRIHDIGHQHWRQDLDIIVTRAGHYLDYIVLPKSQSVDDALTQICALDDLRRSLKIEREIPVHVLIETPGALHDAWKIAGLPRVESMDFGLMDYVSAHHGAIPGSAMRSPGQFEHPLIARAKCEIVAAALGNAIIPTHNVTTELRDPDVVRTDARRARNEFGFLRMWSIHPNQILPIVEAMRPDFDEVTEAAGILLRAQEAEWGPIQFNGTLHDRASYRYYWELLQRAQLTGMPLEDSVMDHFFSSNLSTHKE